MGIYEKTNKGKNFNNKEELKVELIRVWNNISQDFIVKLINSVPKRVAEVVKFKGGHTKY